MTGAADCRRAAVLTTSPEAMPSPSDEFAPRETSASLRNPYAELELLLERELPDSERSADCTLRVVLVRGRRAEECHDRVSDELFDGAAVSLELGADAIVVRAENGAHLLGIELLRFRSEPDKVAEEDGDDLPLLARRERLGAESRPAHPAQAEPLRVLLAAARARNHGERVRR